MLKNLVQLFLVVATSLPAMGQERGLPALPYCNDLKRLAALATTRDGLVSIAGQPRQGNFSDASLSLTGWRDCVVYGTRTYACDSHELSTQAEAVAALGTFVRDIKECLGETWSEIADRSSLGYGVLHDSRHPVSITLSIDRSGDTGHVVRFILFIRGSEAPR